MLGPLQQALLFLINVVFDLYLILLTMRLILCWIRADYYNPVTQFVVKFTQPLVKPLRIVIPTIAHIEFASLVLIIILNMVKFFFLGVITAGLPHNPLGLVLLSLADTLKLILNTFFFAILLQAIMSWINQTYSPVTHFLYQITAPIMRPIQKVVPPVGGIDLSPIPALILLQLLIILVVNPLMTLGWGIAFG